MSRLLKTLASPQGIYRFKGDVYDGVVKAGFDCNGGAGTWPVLDCWAVLALYKLGEEKHARLLFDKLTERLPEEFIPEQMLPDGRRGVSPLGWSHAMYVITAHHLGYSFDTENN